MLLKSKKFKMIFAMAVCHFYFGYYWNNAFKAYGKHYFNDDEYLTYVGAISSLSNGFCKFIIGIALDIVPFKKLYGFTNFIECLCIVLISYSVYVKWHFMVVSCLIWLTDGSLTAMLPAFTVMQFGIKRGPEVYGYMFSVFGLSNLFGIFFVLVVKPYVGFTGMFIVGLAFSMCAGILNILIDK